MSTKSNTDIAGELTVLPDKPGIYQFLDSEGKVIYIGKAKSLKKRVASYFNKDKSVSGKVSVMVRRISSIRHIVVDTEQDAFLLEMMVFTRLTV